MSFLITNLKKLVSEYLTTPSAFPVVLTEDDEENVETSEPDLVGEQQKEEVK